MHEWYSLRWRNCMRTCAWGSCSHATHHQSLNIARPTRLYSTCPLPHSCNVFTSACTCARGWLSCNTVAVLTVWPCMSANNMHLLPAMPPACLHMLSHRIGKNSLLCLAPCLHMACVLVISTCPICTPLPSRSREQGPKGPFMCLCLVGNVPHNIHSQNISPPCSWPYPHLPYPRLPCRCRVRRRRSRRPMRRCRSPAQWAGGVRGSSTRRTRCVWGENVRGQTGS